MMTKIVLRATLALTLGWCGQAFGDKLDESLFTKTSTLTVNYTGAETLEGFPVLVRLSANSPKDFDYADCAADGSDLRFTDETMNLLPHEIDTWNPDGESTVWVKLPALPAATTPTFKLYYGAADGTALPAVTASDVWSKYVAVVHGGSSITNAAASGLKAIAGNGVVASATADLVGGGIAKAQRNSIGLNVQNPVKNAKLTDSNKFTVSGWFKKSAGYTGTSVFMTSVTKWGAAGFLGVCEGGTYFSVAVSSSHQGTDGKGALVGGEWNHAAFSYATAGGAASLRSYWDGESICSKDTAKAITDPGQSYWTFGSYADYATGDSFAGDMDEIRIYDGIASAAWIAAEHDSVATEGWLVADPVQDISGEAKLTVALDTVSQSGAAVTVTGRVKSFAEGRESATVELLYSRSADMSDATSVAATPATMTEPGNFSATAVLLYETTYYLCVRATDSESSATSRVVCFTTGPNMYADPALFAYKSEITLHYAGKETLANFPVLIRLSEGAPEGFEYGSCADDGSDLRFADETGKIVPHEIDTWNADGVSLVWVSVPALNADTTLTMYYGEKGTSYRADASKVWTDADFNSVWHFSGSAAESAQNLVAATVVGTPDYTDATGPLGTAFHPTGSQTLGFSNDGKWATLGPDKELTVSLWAKYDGATANYSRMVSSMSSWTNPSGWEFTIQQAINQITVGSSAQSQFQTNISPSPQNEFVYLTAVYNANKLAQLYVNGACVSSKMLNQIVTPTEKLWIASCNQSNNRWNGKLDEIRIHRAAESADWIAATYATMTSDSFATLDAVEATGGTVPLAIRDNGFVQEGRSATISGRLVNIGTGATSASVKLYWGTTATADATWDFVDLGTFMDKANLSATLTDLVPAGTYYYAFCAVNDAPTPETVWTTVNSFVVDASTRVANEPVVVAENCQITVTAPITSWGVGSTTFELLVGTSAENLAVVDTISDVTTKPEGYAVTFAPVQLGVGTYVYVVRTTTTYGEIVWVNATPSSNSATLADTATYTYKGGTGAWNDRAMWTTTDTGAAGYPTDGCSVVFGDADGDVTVTANLTLKDITISSVGTHALRTPSVGTTYTLKKSGTTTLAGAGGGTLVLDNVILDGKVASLADLKLLAIVNNGQIFPSNSETTDVMLVNGGCIYSGWENGKVFGKLILMGGPNRIASAQNCQYTFSFASLETRPGTGVSMAVVQDGKVTIRDTSTVEMVGGTQTLKDAGSQIPVCTQFTITGQQNQPVRYGKNLCTMDADGVIRMIPQSTMLTSFEGATQLDNVCVADGTTLTSDVTVNAAVFSAATVNLGGHTITVKSGQIREGTSGMWNHVVSGGTFRLCKPNAIGDSTNNADVRMKVDFATEGNEDITTPMLSLDAMNVGYPSQATYTNFVGTVATPFGATVPYSSSMRAPNTVIEMRGMGGLGPSGHYEKANFRGLAGTGYTSTYSTGWAALLWLGTMDEADQAYFNEKNARMVVGNGGFLCPGYIDYDGGRRGYFSMVYGVPQGTIQRFNMLEFRTGSKLMVTVRKDGTCSYIDATGSNPGNAWVSVNLDGTLEVKAVGRIAEGIRFPVLKYREGKRTGTFSSVTDGFKVDYDVAQPDGTYAVTVTRHSPGMTIYIR